MHTIEIHAGYEGVQPPKKDCIENSIEVEGHLPLCDVDRFFEGENQPLFFVFVGV